MRTFAAYFCTFQLRPLQRDKKLVRSWHHLSSIYSLSCIPASSLFSFFFAPTFALPWLSFLPSQGFWCESLGRVPSKVENLVFYKHETGVLFVEGFAEKFLFSFQAQSCPRLFRTLPLTLLRQTAAYKYFQFFSEVLSAAFMCIQLPGKRVSLFV